VVDHIELCGGQRAAIHRSDCTEGV
jgi:hypothetical protein